MNCPKCNTPLKTVALTNVNVDLCEKCEGIWFDKNELQTVMNTYGPDLANSPISQCWDGEIKPADTPNRQLTCPHCNGPLRQYQYCYSSNIAIDGCNAGCGIWLDDTEIRAVYNYLQELKKPIDPVLLAEVEKKLAVAAEEFKIREAALVDGMVTMDDKYQSGPLHIAGEALQSIYALLYKMGL